MINWVKNIIIRNKLVTHISYYVLNYFESLRGTRDALKMHRDNLAKDISIKSGIAVIQNRWPNINQHETTSPIFILSAGWRSGSTLLQRLIMSKEQILVWGEPYSHAGMIDSLSETIKSFTKTWPLDNWFVSEYDTHNLSNLWVANLYPDVKYLHQASLDYMSALFEQPAKKLGFEFWGIKDVRLTIDHAHYLQWLYPNAKFLFLYRNPYKAYMSYRSARDWYKKWPDKPIFTPRSFAEHWRELVSGYINGHKEVNGMLIKYEDLTNSKLDICALKKYLSIDIDPEVLYTKLGSSKVKPHEIPNFELRQIKKIVDPLASKLGYKYHDN